MKIETVGGSRRPWEGEKRKERIAANVPRVLVHHTGMLHGDASSSRSSMNFRNVVSFSLVFFRDSLQGRRPHPRGVDQNSSGVSSANQKTNKAKQIILDCLSHNNALHFSDASGKI